MTKQKSNDSIALNRKARFEFAIEEHFEAGVALKGWEVKSLRAGKVQLDQSYVMVKNGEAFLFGATITPLGTISTHVVAEPLRTRKLLLRQKELSKLIGSVERKGYTLIPLKLYWKENYVKLEIALAKGKKLHDKRADEKEKDWARQKQRLKKDLRD
jgi:SsrA-binding protein